MLVTVILLKSVTELPEMDWVDVPLNTTVLLPRLKVPLFVKLPATLIEDGAFNVPLIVIFAKLVVEPEKVVAPLKTTVPPFALNVPLLVQLPATFMVAEGAVRILLITTLLKDDTLLPEMVVLPPNVAVAEPAFKVPLFVIFPLILKLVDGVSAPLMMIAPKVGVVLPLIVVVPENVIVLEVSRDAELLTRFPARLMLLVLASSVPPLKVSEPLTKALPNKVFVLVPVIITLLNV